VPFEHLHGLHQAPAHAVKGFRENGHLIVAFHRQFRRVQLAHAQLIGHCGEARNRPGDRDDDQYVDRQAVAEEVAFSRRLCARNNWPLIDVTRRSIEETAAAVIAHLTDRRRQAAAP